MEKDINIKLINNVKKVSEIAMQSGFSEIAKTTNKIIEDNNKSKFSIAVVGEFSRGKSTFINKLLGQEILPVGNLPTTAMITSLQFGESQKISVYDKNNSNLGDFEISEKSWDEIYQNKTPEVLSEEEACVLVNNYWLKENNLEILDTPGAGDLEEARAKVVGDALLTCDAAIIAISATSPLSNSEKLFIEQRLITHKVPFLMLVVTKFDLVRKNERAEIINYIENKLKLFKIDVPIYVAYEEFAPVDFNEKCVGIEKIKEQIVAWKNDSERLKLTEQSISAKAMTFSKNLISLLKEKQEISNKNNDEISKLVEEKKLFILKTSLAWEDLRLNLDEKAESCVEYLFNNIPKYTNKILNIVKTSLDDAEDLSNWVSSVYPNLVKRELADVSVNVNADIEIQIKNDINWFNEELMRQFNENIKNISFCDENNIFKENYSENLKQFSFKSEDEKYGFWGSWGLTLGGSLLLSMFFGIPLLISVLGVKTALNSLNKKEFKGRLNEQRTFVFNAISEDIPNVMKNAMSESRKKIKSIYSNIAKLSEEQEKVWKSSQEKIIEETLKGNSEENKPREYNAEISELLELNKQFMKTLNMQ